MPDREAGRWESHDGGRFQEQLAETGTFMGADRIVVVSELVHGAAIDPVTVGAHAFVDGATLCLQIGRFSPSC